MPSPPSKCPDVVKLCENFQNRKKKTLRVCLGQNIHALLSLSHPSLLVLSSLFSSCRHAPCVNSKRHVHMGRFELTHTVRATKREEKRREEKRREEKRREEKRREEKRREEKRREEKRREGKRREREEKREEKRREEKRREEKRDDDRRMSGRKSLMIFFCFPTPFSRHRTRGYQKP